VYHLSALDSARRPEKASSAALRESHQPGLIFLITQEVEDFMRQLSVLCLLLLLCGLASAQTAIVGGTANTWAPGYGVYAAPYVPLVVTPSVTLSTVSPSPVGASNATWGNVAGASNATLSEEFVAPPPVGVFTKPVWYGPSAASHFGGPMHERMRGEKEEQGSSGFVGGVSAGSWSVAQLMTGSAPARKASRTYTNQDVERFNQGTGTVKYRGKTERL
jgi:hypothetical protein